MKNITIQTIDHHFFKGKKNIRLKADIGPMAMFEIIDSATLDANPRSAKVNKITSAIIDSIVNKKEYFECLTRGLVLSASGVETLDNGSAIKMWFNSDKEGIMDGGHNTLAITRFFLSHVLTDKELKKLTTFSAAKQSWIQYRQDVKDAMYRNKNLFDFIIPIEVQYPVVRNDELFEDRLNDIARARNTSTALPSHTLSNHAGYFGPLRESIDPVLDGNIQWKLNDEGKDIDSRLPIALSTIPFLKIKEHNDHYSELNDPHRLQDVSIPSMDKKALYHAKGKIVDSFEILIKNNADYNSENEDFVFKNQIFESAFKLMRVIPKMYDEIYMALPDSLSKLCNLDSVDSFKKSKTLANGKVKMNVSPLYKIDCEYKYPEALIYPIIVSAKELMVINGDEISWKVNDPVSFYLKNLDFIISEYYMIIKEENFNVNKIAKNTFSYLHIERAIQKLINS